MQVSVHEAKTQLSRLLDLVQDGEEVIIQRHGKPIARLQPIAASPAVAFGAMRGEFQMEEGWERPFTDGEAEAFLDGKW